MAAYSWLASRSQAKFQTMKLSPLSARCAAAPAQSTASTCRSLRFSPRSCTDVNLTRTVPVTFPRHFRSKKWSQLVAAYLTCQSVVRVGVFPLHIWHKTSFILTCVKSRSLPVNKARWRNHMTDLRWVRYTWSHGSASRDGSSSQCDGPSRMTTWQGSAAQAPDSAKDDGSSRRVTSQQGGTTRQRMTSQKSWTTQQALLTQHMMMTTQQTLLTQHVMMTTQQALLTQHVMMTTQQTLLTQHMMMTTQQTLLTQHMMMTTQQALLTQHMMMTTQQALLTQHMMTREVWWTHRTIRTWQWMAQLRYMLRKRSFNFLPNVQATGRPSPREPWQPQVLGRRLQRWSNLPSGLPGPFNPRIPWLPACLWWDGPAPTGQNATDHEVGIECPGYPSREHSSCKIGFIHVICPSMAKASNQNSGSSHLVQDV